MATLACAPRSGWQRKARYACAREQPAPQVRSLRARPLDSDLRRKAYSTVAAKLARIVYGLIKSGTDYRPSSKTRSRVDEPSRPCRWGGLVDSADSVLAFHPGGHSVLTTVRTAVRSPPDPVLIMVRALPVDRASHLSGSITHSSLLRKPPQRSISSELLTKLLVRCRSGSPAAVRRG